MVSGLQEKRKMGKVGEEKRCAGSREAVV